MRRVTMASVFGFCKGVENSVALAEKLIAEHPDQEIFMDGDAYAIVGRPKKVKP